jgi:hypothetical protein
VQAVHAAPQWLLSTATHVAPLQQPPLHVCAPPQADEHTWLAWHASSAGQSPEVLHPHAPPTHAAPLDDPEQSAHAPGAPQLAGVFKHTPASFIVGESAGASMEG